MNRRFVEILDECIDYLNNGENLEECLAKYPDHAAELEPLLRTVVDIQTPLKLVPSLQAKSVVKQRINSALDQLERKQKVRNPAFNTRLRWAATFAALAVLLVVLIGYFALNPAVAPGQTNFSLLISDEVNDINDFQHLYVEITSIGIQQGNEFGSWQILDPLDDPDGDGIPGVDLTLLRGVNAVEIWSGNINPGEYSKIFMYVGNVTGVLAGNETGTVKLPGGKLQISRTFTVSDSLVNFVFDIAVHKTNENGNYVLQPQIAASGPDQPFEEVTPKDKLTMLLADFASS